MSEFASTKIAPATSMQERPAAAVMTAEPERQQGTRPLSATIARLAALAALVVGGLALLIVGMVPQPTWQDLGYRSGSPLPQTLLPLVTILFYAIPALVGLLCRRWQAALVLATVPAWLDLGIFAVAVAGQLGPYYLVQSHPDGTVGTLEVYAALGLAGWLVRAGALRLVGMRRK
jgi:hypothetical protein